MGSNCSKTSTANETAIHCPTNPAATSFAGVDLTDGADMGSYLVACQLDADVQVFDSALHDRTSHVMNSLANGAGMNLISLDSFGEVTSCLIDMNEEVVRVILECKKDIWNSQELFDMVQQYFDYSVKTLDLFTSLDKCLREARDRQLIIQVALLQYAEELKNGPISDSVGERYAKTLAELKNFKEAGDPFTKEFFELFKMVAKQQYQLFDKLAIKKRKLDKKLGRLNNYRKLSNIIFATVFVGVIICSVVAAAVAAPPVVAALAAAASAPMGGMGGWLNSLWKKYQTELKAQRQLVNSMHVGTYVTIRELEGIRVLVDRLEVQMESLLGNAELAIRGGGEAVPVVVIEMKKKIDVFMDSIDKLGKHADKYSRDIRRARTMILQRIIRNGSTNS